MKDLVERAVEKYRDAFEKRVAAEDELEAVRRRMNAADKLVDEWRRKENAAQTALLKTVAGVTT